MTEIRSGTSGIPPFDDGDSLYGAGGCLGTPEGSRRNPAGRLLRPALSLIAQADGTPIGLEIALDSDHYSNRDSNRRPRLTRTTTTSTPTVGRDSRGRPRPRLQPSAATHADDHDLDSNHRPRLTWTTMDFRLRSPTMDFRHDFNPRLRLGTTTQ